MSLSALRCTACAFDCMSAFALSPGFAYWCRLAQQQDLEQDILAWDGLLAPEETAARDAVRAWVDTRFAPRITEACSHTVTLLCAACCNTSTYAELCYLPSWARPIQRYAGYQQQAAL